MQNPKYATMPAAKKKINSIPAGAKTEPQVCKMYLRLSKQTCRIQNILLQILWVTLLPFNS